MKSRGRGNPRTSLIFGGLHVTISDCDLEERTAGESQACPAPSPIPMTPLSSLLLLGNVFTFPTQPLWPVPPYGSHLGAAGGTVCLPHCGLFPPLQGISLTHSLGWEPGLLGFPPASWCKAALQASRESLSWFPSSFVGRAFSLGWEVSRIPGGLGWGRHSTPAPPFSPLTQLGGSTCPAWQAQPVLASRLPSLHVGSQDLLLFFLAFFPPWYLGVAIETPLYPHILGSRGLA